MVLIQETWVSVGRAEALNKLYYTTWGFVDKLGHAQWTESDAACGEVAILIYLYSTITETKM